MTLEVYLGPIAALYIIAWTSTTFARLKDFTRNHQKILSESLFGLMDHFMATLVLLFVLIILYVLVLILDWFSCDFHGCSFYIVLGTVFTIVPILAAKFFLGKQLRLIRRKHASAYYAQAFNLAGILSLLYLAFLLTYGSFLLE